MVKQKHIRNVTLVFITSFIITITLCLIVIYLTRTERMMNTIDEYLNVRYNLVTPLNVNIKLKKQAEYLSTELINSNSNIVVNKDRIKNEITNIINTRLIYKEVKFTNKSDGQYLFYAHFAVIYYPNIVENEYCTEYDMTFTIISKNLSYVISNINLDNQKTTNIYGKSIQINNGIINIIDIDYTEHVHSDNCNHG